MSDCLTAEQWRDAVFALYPVETYPHGVSAYVQFWQDQRGLYHYYSATVFVRPAGLRPEGAPGPCASATTGDSLEDRKAEAALEALRMNVARLEAEWRAWDEAHPATAPTGTPDVPRLVETPADIEF